MCRILKSLEDVYSVVKDVQIYQGCDGRLSCTEVYRGQSSDNFKLIPTISRNNFNLVDLLRLEKLLTENFFEAINGKSLDIFQTPSKEGKGQYFKEWFYLFQGKHFDLKTRLMDWSSSWETALLFAVNEEKHFQEDGQFWIFFCPQDNYISESKIKSLFDSHPLNINNTYLINPPFYQQEEFDDYIGPRRMARQDARFFIQPSENIQTPLEEQPEINQYLWKFKIAKESKKIIKDELNKFNINTSWKYYNDSRVVTDLINAINRIIEP